MARRPAVGSGHGHRHCPRSGNLGRPLCRRRVRLERRRVWHPPKTHRGRICAKPGRHVGRQRGSTDALSTANAIQQRPICACPSGNRDPCARSVPIRPAHSADAVIVPGVLHKLVAFACSAPNSARPIEMDEAGWPACLPSEIALILRVGADAMWALCWSSSAAIGQPSPRPAASSLSSGCPNAGAPGTRRLERVIDAAENRRPFLAEADVQVADDEGGGHHAKAHAGAGMQV